MAEAVNLAQFHRLKTPKVPTRVIGKVMVRVGPRSRGVMGEVVIQITKVPRLSQGWRSQGDGRWASVEIARLYLIVNESR